VTGAIIAGHMFEGQIKTTEKEKNKPLFEETYV